MTLAEKVVRTCKLMDKNRSVPVYFENDELWTKRDKLLDYAKRAVADHLLSHSCDGFVQNPTADITKITYIGSLTSFAIEIIFFEKGTKYLTFKTKEELDLAKYEKILFAS